MNNKSIRVVVLEDGVRNPAINMAFGADDVVVVVDLGSRANSQVRAAEISPYRHTLVVSGRTFRIINVVR